MYIMHVGENVKVARGAMNDECANRKPLRKTPAALQVIIMSSTSFLPPPH